MDFNKSVHYDFIGKFLPQDTYNAIFGLQFCVKKQEDGTTKFWNKNGVFEFQKDSNGNYLREEKGEIIKIYDESIEPPEIPNFFMNYLFK